jgi:hypothetical protein
MQLFGIDLCKYKNAAGEPGSKAYSRIFTIRIIDLVSVIVGSYLLSYMLGTSFLKTLVIIFVFGIIVHRVFCVRTAFDKLLFPYE